MTPKEINEKEEQNDIEKRINLMTISLGLVDQRILLQWRNDI